MRTFAFWQGFASSVGRGCWALFRIPTGTTWPCLRTPSLFKYLDDARDRKVSRFRFNAIVVGSWLALGAARERVVTLVLRHATAPNARGVAGGLLLAVWGARFVSSLLYGVVPLDRLRAGGRVDPIAALRAE